MRKKLTITMDEDVYSGIHSTSPNTARHELASAYKAMAEEESREREALEWAEATCGDR